MPSPMPVDSVDQRQPVDGQVAVEMILGIDDQRHADQNSPHQPQSQHHPGPARTSNDGAGRWVGHGEGVRTESRSQTKKSLTEQRNPGSSGRFSTTSFSWREMISSSVAR